MIHPKHLSRILYAASAALVLAACADRPTEPDATSSIGNAAPADPSAGKFWKVGSSVRWNGLARDLLVAPGRAFNPFNEARVLTYLSLAQYNAIIAAENSNDENSDDEDSKSDRSNASGTHPSRAGAAAGASVVVLKHFFPTAAEAALIDDYLAAQKAGPVGRDEKHQDFAAGEAIGRVVGAEVVAYAQSDNTGVLPVPTPPTGPGYWTSSTAPIVRGLFGTRPLALASADQFAPPAPPAFESDAFETDLDEVRVLSANRTPAQLAVAVFWNFRVGRYQNEIATELIVSHRRSEREAAHILALANIAGFDALIGCWHSKFTHWYIRPSQVDASITLPIGLPNHPSYPSGHACVTAAFSEILGQAFRGERRRLAANVEAAGLSRIYGGIHYRFDMVAGQALGRRVAKYVLATDVRGHQPIPLD